ncbi:thioesterase II family protein [Clostridium beijerinckii]|uniref:Surfactin synthase thioesterase subunit n=1 Tax=Clostridium beijerinckii TaxID=1520 RepID=A0AAE5H1P9_CLOBE|nr:thioesterase domain-containing protein [Clostridium beijerinckii]NSB13071.1 surfactin synthase thioesterase subunit [Clostridium beijerinckii]OOM29477.1 linear gramicidin dehydrogenase LgrE [Clostridium beijerinckii]
MILFCLSYAGGSSSIYKKWEKYLDPFIKLYPIELKGRGTRFSEICCDNLDSNVSDIINSIRFILSDNIEYAILGHSMGSLLAYEVYYKIASLGLPLPKHIFFSGYKPPHIPRNEERVYTLPDKGFLQKISEYGGTPPEILNNKELLEIFLPVLRNDFKSIDTYKYIERDSKINCDISVLSGDDDDITADELVQWKYHTSKSCNIYIVEGNHFFINSNFIKVIPIVNKTLYKYVNN